MTTRTRALVIFLLSLVLGTGPAAATSGPTSPETVAGSSIALPVSVRLGDDIGKKLQGTPRPFHKAVRRELVQIWKDAGYEPACRRGGVVKVREFDGRGFAYADMRASTRCAGGGGWYQLFVKDDGQWLTPYALGGHDAPKCSTLRRFNVPRMMGAKVCYDRNGDAPRS